MPGIITHDSALALSPLTEVSLQAFATLYALRNGMVEP
jgi:hypothetical protein